MRALTLLLVAWVATACSAPARPDAPGIDVNEAMLVMRMIATPRVADAGARETAEALELYLSRAGIAVDEQVVGTVDLPGIRVLGAQWRPPRRVTFGDANLILRFGPSTGKALLVMAHYDSVEGSPGAIDNAAAVGVVVALARALQATPPPQPVWLVLTAAEEAGLVGAEALAAEYGDDVAFAIALDLVGGDGELVINGASTRIGAAELRYLADAADRAGMTLSAPAVHRAISRAWPQAERSDHGPFTRRGVRAVHLYNRGSDGEWIDLAYHSARDLPMRVHPVRLAELGRLLRALVVTPPPVHAGDGVWLPFVRHVIVPRGVLVGVEVLLALVALAMVIFARWGLLAWIAGARQRERGPGLLAGMLCYALAAIAAGVVERLASQGHPAAWLHAPGLAITGSALVLVGAFGLLTRGVARMWAWRGDARYLAVAVLVSLSIGGALLAVGAAELAWVWLVPASVLSIAPLLPRVLAIGAVLVSTLPVVVVMYPLRLREAAWNGFFPESLPLAGLLALLAVPTIGSLAWLMRRRTAPGPLGTLLLGLGCGLAVVSGLVVAVTLPPACTPSEFTRFHLACERV